MKFHLNINIPAFRLTQKDGESLESDGLTLEVDVEYEADEIVAINNAFAKNAPLFCNAIADAFGLKQTPDFRVQ